MLDSLAIKDLAYKILDEHKAVNITVLDVSLLTDITDWVIIASATSSRHASTLADKLVNNMKSQGVRPLGEEGEDKGEWVLIDLNDVIVHIMLPEMREFYDLEKLWTTTEALRKQHEN